MSNLSFFNFFFFTFFTLLKSLLFHPKPWFPTIHQICYRQTPKLYNLENCTHYFVQYAKWTSQCEQSTVLKYSMRFAYYICTELNLWTTLYKIFIPSVQNYLLEFWLFSLGSVRMYEGCPKSLASYFFKNRKMMLERYPAMVI